jgi:hypothetical protein
LDFWVFAGTSSLFSSPDSRLLVADQKYRVPRSQVTSWKPAEEQTMALLPTGPRCTLPVPSLWLRRLSLRLFDCGDKGSFSASPDAWLESDNFSHRMGYDYNA